MRATQVERVLALLRQAGKRGITPLDAQREVGTMRLAAQVFQLRKLGNVIDTITEKHAGGTHARYVLRASPGYADVTAADTPEAIEQKVRIAMQPVTEVLREQEPLAVLVPPKPPADHGRVRYVACPRCGGHLLPDVRGGRVCEVCDHQVVP